MIYFAHAAELGLVKIGRTDGTDANGRLADLQTASPVELRLLVTMPGGLDVERELHRHFAHLRVRGEWFRMAPDLAAVIDGARARAGRVLAEDQKDDEGQWPTRWWNPDRPPEWRIAGVAELAYRRGVQHGAAAIASTIELCGTADVARRAGRELVSILGVLRRDPDPHPALVDVALRRLRAIFPFLNPARPAT